MLQYGQTFYNTVLPLDPNVAAVAHCQPCSLAPSGIFSWPALNVPVQVSSLLNHLKPSLPHFLLHFLVNLIRAFNSLDLHNLILLFK